MTPAILAPDVTAIAEGAESVAARIFIAEPDGMYGAAVHRALVRRGLVECILPSSGIDLRDSASIDAFFAAARPTAVYLAAGEKGGISANQRRPADLMLDNLLVGTNVIQSAFRHGARKLLYLASSCVYPRDGQQPLREASLGSGALEPTSEAYSTAKLASLRLCQAFRRQYGCDFITGIPTNIFGPGDSFDPENAHVVGGLIRRISQARDEGQPAIEIWGTGEARRELLYVDDLGDACVFLTQHYSEIEPINIGSGSEVSIRELASMLREIIGFQGELRFDTSKPDGAPRKSLEGGRLDALGWKPTTSLRTGLEQTVRWFDECQRQNDTAQVGNG